MSILDARSFIHLTFITSLFRVSSLSFQFPVKEEFWVNTVSSPGAEALCWLMSSLYDLTCLRWNTDMHKKKKKWHHPHPKTPNFNRLWKHLANTLRCRKARKPMWSFYSFLLEHSDLVRCWIYTGSHVSGDPSACEHKCLPSHTDWCVLLLDCPLRSGPHARLRHLGKITGGEKKKLSWPNEPRLLNERKVVVCFGVLFLSVCFVCFALFGS